MFQQFSTTTSPLRGSAFVSGFFPQARPLGAIARGWTRPRPSGLRGGKGEAYPSEKPATKSGLFGGILTF